MHTTIIKVVPGARKIRVARMLQGLKVWLTALPEDGQANAQLIETLADYYNVSKDDVVIKSGHTGRIKIVRIG